MSDKNGMNMLSEADTVLDTVLIKAKPDDSAESSIEESDEGATIPIPSDLDRLRTGGYSAVGKRKSQQDAAFVSEVYQYIVRERALAVMCDGMGGLNGGELASTYCVNAMKTEFERIFRPDVAEEQKDIPRFFALMLDAMDQKVKSMINEKGEPLGAGTTFTGVILDGRDLYWASVGDSHIYILNDSGLNLVTTEHNLKMLLDRQVAAGQITREEAESNRQRDALVSFLGMGGLKFTDIVEKPYRMRGGDCVLLCSDGLYRTLTDNEMTAIILRAGDDMETAARVLVETAIAKNRPHQDNTTAVLLKYLG